MEELAQHVDVVETYLLREIAARSDNFFEAAGVVQDLRGAVGRAYEDVKALRRTVTGLDEEFLEAVVQVQRLQRRRRNLKTVLQKLQVASNVAQSQAALQLLVPQGDYAAALDVMEDIRGTMQSEHLTTLHSLRHLPQVLAGTADVVDQLMVSDFLRAVQCQAVEAIIDHVAAALQQVGSRRTSRDAELFRLTSDDGSKDLRRSFSLASGAAAEDLVIFTLPPGQQDAAAALLAVCKRTTADELQIAFQDGEQLQDLLLPLVVDLRRTDMLSHAVHRYIESVTIEAKHSIRTLVERALPLLLGQQWTSLESMSLADKLQALPSSIFLQLLAAVSRVTQTLLQHVCRIRDVTDSVLRVARCTRAQLAQHSSEFALVLQAVAEATSGRLSKLLGSRVAVGSRTRLEDLQALLALSEAFSAMIEATGCKPVSALRSAVQLQCKASIDGLHQHNMQQLTGVLEQESWTLAQVPPQLQAICTKFERRAGELAPGPDSPQPVTSDQGELQAHGHALPSLPPLTNCRNTCLIGSRADGSEEIADDALVICNRRFHVVTAVLMLLRMLEGYAAFQECVPSHASEAARRAIELLKVRGQTELTYDSAVCCTDFDLLHVQLFNSRTCQLVLGAGAMQVSGLKSITAKHLALSCQCLSALIALHPVLSLVLMALVQQPRLGLLQPEFDRVLQDLTVHRTEIHSKLVAIMRERLATNLKQLPAVADMWGHQPQGEQELAGPPAPSHFALTSSKQLRILSQVLTPLLLPEECEQIFGRVGLVFSKSLADSFERLLPQGSAWAAQCASDVGHLTAALADLPMSEGDKQETVARLQALRERRFVLQASRLGAFPHTRSSFDTAAALYYSNGGHSDAPSEGAARPQNQLRAVDRVRNAPQEAAQPLGQPPQPAQQLQEQEQERLQHQEAGHREDIDPLHAAAGIGSSSPRVLRRYFTEGSTGPQGSPVLLMGEQSCLDPPPHIN
eukprot:jgi/Astpho2/2136/Aster-x1055